MFYLGTHEPSWLWNEKLRGIPLFISHMRLRRRRTPFPPGLTHWALDSGGFSEIKAHGKWTVTPEEYVRATRQYRDEIGMLDWAAPQDWMCEPDMLVRTGLTIEEHQRRTVVSFLQLREMAPDLPFAPVLQGWTVQDYVRCIQLYDRAGVDLHSAGVVGVGSVCRRQSTDEINRIFRMLHFEGLTNLHGFGVKSEGLAQYSRFLSSSDSLAWSFDGRYLKRPTAECSRRYHQNCLHHALAWRRRVLEAA